MQSCGRLFKEQLAEAEETDRGLVFIEVMCVPESL